MPAPQNYLAVIKVEGKDFPALDPDECRALVRKVAEAMGVVD